VRIEAAPLCNRVAKKLAPALKRGLDEEILSLTDDPCKGERTKGVLRDVSVTKFNAVNDQWLLAYRVLEKEQVIQLLYCGQHENFYRDLTKYLQR